MQHYPVIVLGGGTMGTAAAWDLGKRGIPALVLEQFGHVHSFGSHGGKTRVIRHAYAEGADYVPLVQRADALWRALEDECQQRILIRTGGLDIAAPGFSQARSARNSAEKIGLPHEWLDGAEIRRRWPAWALDDDWEACYSPGAGFLIVETALHALAGEARNLGVTIQDNEPVRDWGADGSGAWVRTDTATYRCDHLIITAGAWTRQLMTSLGLPLTVLRKVLWWFAVNDESLYAPDRFPVFITESDFGEIYGLPIYGDPGFKIARHSDGEPVDPNTVDRSTSPEEREQVLPLARHALHGVTDRAVHSAVCLYTMTPDTDFIVDRHPEWPHVVFGAGFSGHGFKFATAIGEHLTSLAVEPGTVPYPRFTATRFTSAAR